MSEVRYCKTEDGVRIAYSVEGEGPVVVVTPYYIESFSLDHLIPEQVDFMRRFRDGRTIVRYDLRGVGLSQRSGVHTTVDSGALDLKAVIAAATSASVSLCGLVNGCPSAIRVAVENPSLVDRLVLYGGYAWLRGVSSRESEAMVALARSNWPMAAQALADYSTRREFASSALAIADVYRQSTTGEYVAELYDVLGQVDVRPLLGRVSVPTLVLHRIDDEVWPFALGRKLAEEIPGAQFAPMPGTTSFPFLGDSDSILNAMDRFLSPPEAAVQVDPQSVTAGAFRTVLFTDIVGHTEMMARLGDARGRDVLREHERITREVLAAHGGAEVKTMGDGFMASFGSVTSAVECAVALQKGFGAWNDGDGGAKAPLIQEPVSIRVGLNAGEPIEEDGDLFGSTVILASRICGMAGAGEILVPETVRGLLLGKGFVFGDRGEFVPKGFDEGVRVWEVRWRE